MQDRSDRLSQVSPVEWIAACVWSLATADAAVILVRWYAGTLNPSVSAFGSAACGILSVLLCVGCAWVVSGVNQELIVHSHAIPFSFRSLRGQFRIAGGFAGWTVPGILRGWLGSNSSGPLDLFWLVAVAGIAATVATIFSVRSPSALDSTKNASPQLPASRDEPLISTIPLRPTSQSVSTLRSERLPATQAYFPAVEPGMQAPHLSVVSPETDTEEDEECWNSQGTRLQWTCRTLMEDRSEEFEGTFRVPLAAGQKTSALHVPFCPSLPSTPEVFVELVDEEAGMRWKAAAVHPYGLRIELRRGNSERDMDIVVSVRAVASAATAMRAV